MNKVIKFESSSQRRTTIEEAACAWLAKLEAGASEDELRALSAWLYESREHIEIFFEVSAAWDQLTILLELSEVFPLEKYKLPAAGRKSGFWSGMAAITTLVMVMAVAAGIMRYGFVSGQSSDGLVDVTTYKTDVGQRSTVTLPDGSEIVLNTNTLLEVRYSGVERRIVLDKGEALFTVTKDSVRPFRVVVGSHIVEAVGTEFAVQKLVDDAVEVMVTDGVVDVRNVGNGVNGASNKTLPGPGGLQERISLAAGEIITSEGADNEVIEKQNIPFEEIESRLAWQHGMLSFLDKPLDQVIKEVNRYTTTVIVTDEEVRDIRVDGSFRVGDIDALLLAMKENFGMEVITMGDGYVYLSKMDTQ